MNLGFVEDKAYQKAREFLIRNEPERRLDLRLSFKCFRALQELSHTAKKPGTACLTMHTYPRVEYSSKDSTVTIITAQSGLHGMAAEALQRCIEDGLRTELTKYANDVLLNELDDQSNLSVKKPDGGLLYVKNGVQTIIAVVEVGVSESFARLKVDMRRWMDEFHCQTGILFSLKERPKFRYPAHAAMTRYSVNDPVPFRNAMTQYALNQPFGPYRYNGHDWFGAIGTAFIEIYRQDQVGPPQRTNVIENRQMLLQGNDNVVGLTVADLFPPGEEDIQGIEQVLVLFDAARVQNSLATGACRTAMTRFNGAVGRA
ncbi:hypothetical protein V1525DRAFT_427991 [Lipomyces kononenkoae]|uniref:Uncharacterized protein n=1 Tax=Lipomyces kononenkoae TaxID=34357 RepID=A0ACC3SVP7_LIPKO